MYCYFSTGNSKYFSPLTSFVSAQHIQGLWKFLDYTEPHYSQNNTGLSASTPNPCVFWCSRLFYQYPNLTLLLGKMVIFLADTEYPLQKHFSLQLSVNIFVVSTFECPRKTRLGQKQFLSYLINCESHCRKVRKRPPRSHFWSPVTFLSENHKTALGQDYDPFNPKFCPFYWQEITLFTEATQSVDTFCCPLLLPNEIFNYKNGNKIFNQPPKSLHPSENLNGKSAMHLKL